MTQNVLKDAEGNPLYYWNTVENGIHFEFEYYARTKDEGDFETSFTMPHSEYYKVYAKYGIDQSVPMEDAIAQISESGRGAELQDDLIDNIERVDKFSWISFED